MDRFLQQGRLSQVTACPPEMATTVFAIFQTVGFDPLVTHENIRVYSKQEYILL